MKKILLSGLVAITLMVGGATAAFAQTVDPAEGNLSPDTPVGFGFTINNTLVTLLLGAFLPLVIGVLQHPNSPEWVKVILGGAVTAVAVGISEVIQADGSAFLSQEWLVELGITWAFTIGSYLGIWKPVGINERTGTGVPLVKR